MAGLLASIRPVDPLPTLTRFDVVRRLGEGGAGFVYEAIDRDRDGRVALKMLRVLDGEMLLQLKEEFRSLQDLEHRNLIRLFELSCEGDKWFFTMELVEGVGFSTYVGGVPERKERDASRDLDTLSSGTTIAGGARSRKQARTPRALDEEKLRSALVQLAEGLNALHAAGKVHRDIKSSNVLVTTEGRVVILDLGLVRDAEDVAEDKSLVVGTISHMAPEQAAGSDVGPAADWYSVGAVLYQCLTGHYPFEGDALEVLSRKQVEDPPRPSELASGVPADLEALCMDLLSRVPGARPTGADVLQRLEARSIVAGPPVVGVPPAASPFVGRRGELDALREAFDRARAGEATTVVVEGESGVGKSAMVKRFTRQLQDELGALVLSGRCYEREDVPYKAIDGVIDSLSNHLATLSRRGAREVLPATAFVLSHAFPVLQRVPAMDPGAAPKPRGLAESRSLLFATLRELLGNLAAKRPLVVVIDDLQWADADSLTLLAEVLRTPAPPMLLIATARATRSSGQIPAEASPHDERSPFGLPGDVRRIPLTRLSDDEGLELVRMLGGRDLSMSLARRIANEAGGHPLFVDELVRHSQLTGEVAPANILLDDALVARVQRLDPDARSLLELLAVAGIAVPQEIAMRALGVSFGDFANQAQTLRAAHLARTDGWRGADAIETYHDRVREAVASRLDSEARVQVHARLAGAHEAARIQDPDALSTHWLGARNETKAGEYALLAARHAAAAFAFERAAQLYERALTLGHVDEATKQELRLERAEALASAGRGGDAAQVYFEAANHASADAALDLRRRAAEELLTAGRIDEGDAILRDVLAAVGISLPRTAFVALLGFLLFRVVLFFRGFGFRATPEGQIAPATLTRVDACLGVGRILSVVDTIRGAYFQSRGLVYALDCGEPTRVSYALSMEAVYIVTSGSDAHRTARSSVLRAQARAIAQRTDDVRVQALVETATGYTNLVLGRFADSRTYNDLGARTLRDHSPGAFWDIRTAELGAIWPVGWMGDLNDLAKRVEQIAREAERRGDIYALATVRTGVSNLVWLRHGDVQTARRNALEASKRWTQRDYQNQHYWAFLALTRIELYEGDPRAATDRVAREWPRIARALILEVRLIKVEAIHLRASTALSVARDARGGERTQAIRAAERDARTLARMNWTVATPFAQSVRAGALALRGNEERACVLLDAASRGFDELGMALHAACNKWQHGTLNGGDLGRHGVATAETWMAEQAIAEPARMAEMIAPGFRR